MDGAIHRVGGDDIMKELDVIRTQKGGCPTGFAVATSAGNLNAKWVFHAVGPIYSKKARDSELLSSAYRSCMKLAKEKGCSSIAFPSLSTGIYGYPIELAAPIAIRTVSHGLKNSTLAKATFVLFDTRTFNAFCEALNL